ncbi:hypothetical protein N7478_004430 [Penicillium angulare]|uniref:uncharacterized protein n=1 Tax=Penicillium angulare TaxID=116970 RepID=UPI002541A85D|nr:uncharacterized protein N7478_004430 [Penicillium angulare]KAJ5279058.1 hypothetical protein N7478_004430 [Penicillium angulare]
MASPLSWGLQGNFQGCIEGYHGMMGIYLKLISLLSDISNDEQFSDEKLLLNFEKLPSTLKQLAAMGRELESVNLLQVLNPKKQTFRCFASLMLAYNQYSPLPYGKELLSTLLQEFLDAAAKSASNIISILLALEKHQQLNSFLPFDAECLFLATSFLTLFALINPEKVNCRFYALTCHLLNAFISQGNAAASFKKLELERLWKVIWTLQLTIA